AASNRKILRFQNFRIANKGPPSGNRKIFRFLYLWFPDHVRQSGRVTWRTYEYSRNHLVSPPHVACPPRSGKSGNQILRIPEGWLRSEISGFVTQLVLRTI